MSRGGMTVTPVNWRKVGGDRQERGYSKLARAPKAFNDTEMVDCYGREEEGGRIGVAGLDF